METLLEVLVKEIQKQVESQSPDYERLETLNRLFSSISHHLRMVAETNKHKE